ncbi:hypothetical protein PC116_g4899 [Phytophthora cactorum]|uniref:Uncharacterized protein n=1 Tax=Phytophthora cactorum TaxID=29920 RepID=A0A8T1ENH8_9STRA|nr:hypothetical protein Pcac1_g22543 [Phytophthora cactorum]KAG2953430.1 hypothetical protein PC117_g2035 [Phytophthora cactorum]KAG3034281.1 hypothetical protein PC120_g1503 [Phytophthora cactorum]KAG4063437.1 hypothetical protein PC123_g1778 [Phytophthora cactorum]KAG4247345.1 hypothetical protein PC116_g4899 [Phytophthora cactorum]
MCVTKVTNQPKLVWLKLTGGNEGDDVEQVTAVLAKLDTQRR